MRVLAALSGGVDSAVAAALAVQAGHEVTAVHMALSSEQAATRCGSRGCCTVEDATDARQAAAMLGIPFYVWDLSDTFHDTVINDFISEYREGRTPNPCVRCNEFVKFHELLERGRALGFDAVCTGHYANLTVAADGEVFLSRAACEEKDQSYVVAVMGQEALRHTLFPLGGFPSKAKVREKAAELGFPMSSKPDSYDICFIPDGDTSGFLRRHLGEKEGEIVDESGTVVGTHRGAYQFTVGQRKGLGLTRPAADGKPRYVLGTDVESNRVFVGSLTGLRVNRIDCDHLVPLAPLTHPGLNGEREVLIQYRAHGQHVPGRVYVENAGPGLIDEQGVLADDARLVVELTQETRAVAPGQSLVVYDEGRALIEATIVKATRREN